MPYKDPQKRREYHRQYISGWRKRNRDKVNASYAKHYKKTKLLVMEHYGGNPAKCACCNESTYEFLCIDHIHGGGLKHRREIKGAQNLYKWLVKYEFPDGFQVLCYNCNAAKYFSNGCPHKSKAKV